MRLDGFYFVLVSARVFASPLQQVPVDRRGLVDYISSLATENPNTGDDAIPALSRELIEISKNVEGALPELSPRDILTDLSQFTLPALDGFTVEAVGNAAIWQEAVDLDAKINPKEILNQYFIRLLDFVQQAAFNTSIAFETRVSMARGLQYLQVYPARFDQAQAAVPADTLVQMSPAPQQTIQSFGASGAWWPNYLKHFPVEQQKNLSSLLFSEDWLHLSGYRYNMGASGHNDSQAVTTPGRGVESFMLTDASYDWRRDGPGVYYLKAAHEAGVTSITAFVNAMPAALTAEKRPCGATLSAEAIPAFVTYTTTVLSRLVEQDKIRIDYISPMNEPDNNFIACNQEGMAVQTSERAAVFQQLRAGLQASTTPGLKAIKIMGDETSQIASEALGEYSTWLPSALASQSIDAISVHMYDFPDDTTLLNYRQFVVNQSLPNSPPPIKQTEVSTFTTARDLWAPWGKTGGKTFGPEYDPSIHSALDMARFIWQWLTLVNAESWDWWTAVSNMMPCSPSKVPECATTFTNTSGSAFNDGLLYIDPAYAETKDYTFYFTKRFWVFKHFTTFLRPGAVRYDIPNELLPYGTVAVAARNMDGVYSTIFVNRNATEQAIRMQLPGVSGKLTKAVQTTDAVDFEDVAPLPVVAADGTFRVTLPAKGVLSVQFTVAGGGNGPVAGRMRKGKRGYPQTAQSGGSSLEENEDDVS
ncbi:MAG: hypothetical protein Q9207_002485 [Kuettlingeria erythrocarpa]